MSAAVWPPLSSSQRIQEEESSLVRSIHPSFHPSILPSFPTKPPRFASLNTRSNAQATPTNFDKTSLSSLQASELEWLLNTLQDTLASLKSGLQECVALLAAEEPGSTLALSTLRSECVKGFVTRVGTRMVKGVSPWGFFLFFLKI